MISSPLAVLKSPASGVSGAVTGYPIGRGNGVSTIFAAPPEITAISALYRRDWQGNVALSASARTNLCPGSQTIGGGQWTNINVASSVSGVAPDGSSTGWVVTATLRTVSYAQSASMSVAPATNIPVSLYIKSGTTDTTQISVWDGSVGTRIALQDVNWSGGKPSLGDMTGYTSPSLTIDTGGWYKFSAFVNSGAFTAIRLLIYPDTANNLRSVSIWGVMVGATGAYIPTTTAPVALTDYAASGTTLTLAKAPTLAAELTVDGTGVNLPLLQIGG